jgi:hypothetical protein
MHADAAGASRVVWIQIVERHFVVASAILQWPLRIYLRHARRRVRLLLQEKSSERRHACSQRNVKVTVVVELETDWCRRLTPFADLAQAINHGDVVGRQRPHQDRRFLIVEGLRESN